jgi:hypothetical protein
MWLVSNTTSIPLLCFPRDPLKVTACLSSRVVEAKDLEMTHSTWEDFGCSSMVLEYVIGEIILIRDQIYFKLKLHNILLKVS